MVDWIDNIGDFFTGGEDGDGVIGGIAGGLQDILLEEGEDGSSSVRWDTVLPLLGGAAMASGAGDSSSQQVGYQGSIPKYTAQRSRVQDAPPEGRRPGGAGQRYFSPVQYEPQEMASGGIASAQPKGFYLGGSTDGMADKIRTSIEGQRPAELSHGEFVIPADVVSHLGNGNSEAGAQALYDMMDRIRKARTGSKKQGREINPDRFTPKEAGNGQRQR